MTHFSDFPLRFKASPFPLSLLRSFQFGFSPHENFLLSGQPRQMGLISTIEVKNISELRKRISCLSDPEREKLKKSGIEDLSLFVKESNRKGYVFAYFQYARKDFRKAEQLLMASSSTMTRLSELLVPHPRADSGAFWLNMEWINCVGSTTVYPYSTAVSGVDEGQGQFDYSTIQRMGLMSRLAPQKEVEYRLLHQSNWPGNTEWMVECNYRNWTTFLIEFGDELMLFSYTEYIGTDRVADNAKMGENPVTQRWWNVAKPCLIPWGTDDYWTPMESEFPDTP